ncbi:unnamed protein product [Parascedosporium putredinis]|uniref:Uncharacterized protein n=1 Tax=Parascedosporium putredinis TaxID=1442378 RepID=A0A9P1HCB6_9PEZI|nr:unnamed protein product [Parascedosporium putredinis]CAI8002923.1 unnamed protein product [Parascedosporium putredinis]
MLDENLPTFRFQAAKDSPANTLLLFSERGSDPSPTFLIRRPDPSSSASRAKFAAALADASFPSIIYAEALVEPEWTQPPLSTAEARAAAASGSSASGSSAPATPVVPDVVSLSLYDPDQTVVLRHIQSGWNKSESWEFEMPERSFKLPSASLLDRESQAAAAGPDNPTSGGPDPSVPRIMFRWKRDGRMSKDMTCYLVGKSVDGRKSREPDITIALFAQGKSDALTIYEPNMRRVELEDRKGLEVVLLLGAELIRGLPHSKSNPRRPRRRDQAPTSHRGRERAAQGQEREKRDREEQERIRKMLKDEEKEARRREAEIEKETERLRKEYGVQGQQMPANANANAVAGPSGASRPPLPPRPAQGSGSGSNLAPPGAWPQRPVSAGPGTYPHWSPPPPQQQQQQQQQQFAAPPPQGQPGAASSSHGGLRRRLRAS